MSAVLLHAHVHDGGLAAELDVVDGEGRWAGLGPSQEFHMEGDCMGLVLGCEGGAEVRFDYLEEADMVWLVGMLCMMRVCKVPPYHPVTYPPFGTTWVSKTEL